MLSLNDRRAASEGKFVQDQTAAFRAFTTRSRAAAEWVAQEAGLGETWADQAVAMAVALRVAHPEGKATEEFIKILAEAIGDPARADDIRSRMS